MASEGGGAHGAGALPSATLQDTPMAVGDAYGSSQQFRSSFDRNMASEGRAGRLNKRGSGGRYKVVRCTGAIIDFETADKAARAVTKGCQARARACKQATNEWKVTEVHLRHENCTGQAPPAAGSAPKKQRICRRSIEPEAMALIRSNSRLSAGALSMTLKATKSLDIPERTANRMINEERGRSKAALNQDYQLLASYMELLGRGNGNVVECKFDAEGAFESAFLMLGAAKRMATAGVQQVYAMDSAHLKETWNGQFGTLSFKDANNKIILVAVRVQGKENGEMYKKLLEKAMEAPALREILNNNKTTCFTDKHKGSDSAVPQMCPDTEHRRCVEHLLKLLSGTVIGQGGRHHVYQMARKPTKAAFEHHMGEVEKLNPGAAQKLRTIPPNTWANYACRDNPIWDQVTSNMAESVNNMVGHETRSKSVLGFFHDIVMQTARRLDDSAHLKVTDPAAVMTPFAMKTYNAEFTLADQLSVSPNGGDSFMVYPQENSYLSNRVELVWGQGPNAKHTYACTCKFCSRFKIPCCHVLAVAKATNMAYRALELIDKGYSLATYRAAASDPNHRIVPPVWDDLTANKNHHAPEWVEGQSGRPAKGPRVRKRIISNGANVTSSRAYAIQDAAVRAADGRCIPRRDGGGAAAGGGEAAGAAGAAGSASGASSAPVDLSQGASQGAL